MSVKVVVLSRVKRNKVYLAQGAEIEIPEEEFASYPHLYQSVEENQKQKMEKRVLEEKQQNIGNVRHAATTRQFQTAVKNAQGAAAILANERATQAMATAELAQK